MVSKLLHQIVSLIPPSRDGCYISDSDIMTYSISTSSGPQFAGVVPVELRVVDGDEQVAEQRGEHGEVRHHVISLVRGHLDAARQQRDQRRRGRREQGHLG